jgi:hypothetical protein
MYIFGGILEVTKELNDLIRFDLTSKSFTIIDPNGESEHIYHSRFDDGNH